MGGVACPLLAAWRVKIDREHAAPPVAAAQRTRSAAPVPQPRSTTARVGSCRGAKEARPERAPAGLPPHRSCARPGQRNARPRATTARTRPGLECGCSSRGDRGSRRWRPLAIEKRHYLVPQGRRVRQKRRVSGPGDREPPPPGQRRGKKLARSRVREAIVLAGDHGVASAMSPSTPRRSALRRMSRQVSSPSGSGAGRLRAAARSSRSVTRGSAAPSTWSARKSCTAR